MDIQLHAPVVSHDGVDVGKIDRVIFDPASGETRSIIVRKGAILPRDTEIPVEAIRVAAPSRVELTMSSAEVGALPEFMETYYVWPPETWVAPYGWPPGAVLWPAEFPVFPVTTAPVRGEVADRARLDAEQTAVLGQGSEVVARGGEKVGEVQNVLVDPETHRPSRLLLRRGFLFTQDVEIPGDWIDSVENQKVALNVDKVTVEQLAQHSKRD